ncbi:hypothetical protein GGI00_004124, partial [Coemansia sp. RSA 2681]
RYDDYARHAKLMTEIHALPKTTKPSAGGADKLEATAASTAGGAENRDPAAAAAIKDKKKKNLKRF